VEEAQHRSQLTNVSTATTRSGAPVALALGISALVIGILAGHLLRPLIMPWFAGLPSASQTTTIDTAIAQIRHFTGDPNAPVTIIVFSDFQCPFCERFATGALRQIDQAYVKTGQVRVGYQHMIFLGNESQWAAEASECAADQDAFWSYHDRLFERQAGENQGAFTKDKLKLIAADLGLDNVAFGACLDSGKYTQLVRDSTQATRSLGVVATPAFFVNDQRLVGAQPFETFQRLIGAEMSSRR
jgi:protein-disulfide isomerase